MTRSRIVAALAFLVLLATLARATRCSSGAEVLVGVVLTGVLTALWNDGSERVAVVSPAEPGAAAVM